MAKIASPRRGVDILADILQFCEPATVNNIMTGLKRTMPNIVSELRKRIVIFEDLALADPAGIQRLVKLTTLHDLAMSLKGATEDVLHNIAANMSQRAIQDLREEITLLGPKPLKEIESARARITETARKLLERKELYFKKAKENWIE